MAVAIEDVPPYLEPLLQMATELFSGWVRIVRLPRVSLRRLRRTISPSGEPSSALVNMAL
jgi:hypothetical protein